MLITKKTCLHKLKIGMTLVHHFSNLFAKKKESLGGSIYEEDRKESEEYGIHFLHTIMWSCSLEFVMTFTFIVWAIVNIGKGKGEKIDIQTE